MPVNIDSFILPDNIIKEMKTKIKETKKSKLEIGFALCKNQNSDIIVKGTECIGTKCSVKEGTCHHPDQAYIGNFHTHPRTHPTMSIYDMVSGCMTNIECIGSVPFNSISCFSRKTDKNQCNENIVPFKVIEDQLSERKENIGKALKSPISIAKTGIYRFLKDINQYETDVTIYHRNRARLLHENFNRINIR